MNQLPKPVRCPATDHNSANPRRSTHYLTIPHLEIESMNINHLGKTETDIQTKLFQEMEVKIVNKFVKNAFNRSTPVSSGLMTFHHVS